MKRQQDTHSLPDRALRKLALPSAIAVALFGSYGHKAYAADECGVAIAGGSITCDATTYTTGPTDKISYRLDGLDLTASDISIINSTEIGTGPAIAIRANDDHTNDLRITANSLILTTGDSSQFGQSNTDPIPGRFADGLRAEQRGTGATTVVANNTNIITYGYNASGVYAWQRATNDANNSLVTAELLDGSSVETSGRFSHGLYGRTDTGLGDILVRAVDSSVVTHGRSSLGVRGLNVANAAGANGDVTVNVENSSVLTRAENSHGVRADNNSSGNAIVVVTGSEVEARQDVIIEVDDITPAHGVFASTESGGSASAIVDNSEISTGGDGGHGVFVMTEDGGTASAIIDSSGISTGGDGGHGVFVSTEDGGATSITLQGDANVATAGDSSEGLFALSNGTAGDAIIVVEGGEISTVGANSEGTVAQVEGSGGASSGNAQVTMNLRR